MLRAIGETEIEGIATTMPAHVAILTHPDFIAGEHSTKWVEETLDLSGIGVTAPPPAPADPEEAALVERRTTVEVNGKRFDVKLWVPESAGVAAAPRAKKVTRQSGGGRR